MTPSCRIRARSKNKLYDRLHHLFAGSVVASPGKLSAITGTDLPGRQCDVDMLAIGRRKFGHGIRRAFCASQAKVSCSYKLVAAAAGKVLRPTLSGQRIQRNFHNTSPMLDTVRITFFDTASGEEHDVQAEVGKHLLDVAIDNNIELEGACGGELACATCHLIFEEDMYATLPEKLDEEEDMLDLAYDLTDTSRLGCQITVKERMAGMRVTIPDDGF